MIQRLPLNRNLINVYPSSMGVNLEVSGSRRNQTYDNFDLRAEKEFTFKFGKVSVFADIYNLLGNQYVYVGLNPGGTWYPTDVAGTTGTFTAGSTYGKVTGLSGTRTYKFSVRYQF
jgi:hypothetical protein